MKNNKFETATYIMGFAGLGCFILSFVAMGLAPWTTLKNVTEVAQKSFANPYYDENRELTSIGRGRKIYIKEACWHCHSQFVRPVAGEPYRYGPTSMAFESMYDVPQTFGTRRVGPDLSRQAGRHPDDWHFAHLYNPRSTVPESIMPSYPWMFEKTPDGPKPTQEAKDLVAYLQNLGVTYKDQIQAIVYPSLFKVSGAPIVDDVTLERGEQLFKQNCVGCHGQTGNGVGSAFAFLQPRAANLVDRFISPSEAYSVLNRGVLGSSMPSFREMPERDLWAIASYVSKLGEHNKENLSKEFDPRLVSKGQNIYRVNCASCHGETGAGDGAVAAALNPRPKDFTRRIFSKNHLKEILDNGVPGSVMPPFKQLEGEDFDAISIYLDSLYKEGL